jgi:hypothetical protein
MTEPALSTTRSKTFPGKVRGTADPSATLGMTKRKGLLLDGKQLPRRKCFHHLDPSASLRMTTFDMQKQRKI